MSQIIEDIREIKKKEGEIRDILDKYQKNNTFGHNIIQENLSSTFRQIIDLIDK